MGNDKITALIPVPDKKQERLQKLGRNHLTFFKEGGRIKTILMEFLIG